MSVDTALARSSESYKKTVVAVEFKKPVALRVGASGLI